MLAATVAILSNLKDDGLVYEHLSIVDGAQDRLVYASELLFLIDELGLNLGFDLSLLGDVAALADLLSVPVVDDE